VEVFERTGEGWEAGVDVKGKANARHFPNGGAAKRGYGKRASFSVNQGKKRRTIPLPNPLAPSESHIPSKEGGGSRKGKKVQERGESHVWGGTFYLPEKPQTPKPGRVLKRHFWKEGGTVTAVSREGNPARNAADET